jgi:hypothetical protein
MSDFWAIPLRRSGFFGDGQLAKSAKLVGVPRLEP